mmetsp:Transcript_62042/g.145567  ORF Transcript_62042/g.145567 Transcript_62042/m.145567 type:complete len:92 (-) Transcript_62042:2-277(-)
MLVALAACNPQRCDAILKPIHVFTIGHQGGDRPNLPFQTFETAVCRSPAERLFARALQTAPMRHIAMSRRMEAMEDIDKRRTIGEEFVKQR